MSFSVNNRLVFIDNFQFLNSSLDIADNLSHKFDGELLILVKQKRFYPYECINGLTISKKDYLVKTNFIFQ